MGFHMTHVTRPLTSILANHQPTTAPTCCPMADLWRDAYGRWHCADCEPPVVESMIREKLIKGGVTKNNGGEKPAEWPVGGWAQPFVVCESDAEVVAFYRSRGLSIVGDRATIDRIVGQLEERGCAGRAR